MVISHRHHPQISVVFKVESGQMSGDVALPISAANEHVPFHGMITPGDSGTLADPVATGQRNWHPSFCER